MQRDQAGVMHCLSLLQHGSVAYLMLAGFTLGCCTQTRKLDGAMLLCLMQAFGVIGGVPHKYGHGQVCKLLSISLHQQANLYCKWLLLTGFKHKCMLAETGTC